MPALQLYDVHRDSILGVAGKGSLRWAGFFLFTVMIQKFSRSDPSGKMGCLSDNIPQFIHRLMIEYEYETKKPYLVCGARYPNGGRMRLLAHGDSGNSSEAD